MPISLPPGTRAVTRYGGSTAYCDETDFFFQLEPKGHENAKNKPPRARLVKTLVSKAFVTSCRDRAPFPNRYRTLPLLNGFSTDKRALLDRDELGTTLNMEEASDSTSDLISDDEASYTPPHSIRTPNIVKRQLKAAKTRVRLSFKNLVEKRQYRTMPDDLFGGIEVPLQAHELMIQFTSSSEDDHNDSATTKYKNGQKVLWPTSVDSSSDSDISHDSAPHLMPLSKQPDIGSKEMEPSMEVHYENDCAQLVFGKDEPPDTPFDEQHNAVLYEGIEVFMDEEDDSSSPSDEEGSEMRQPSSWSTSSPVQDILDMKDTYGSHWETLGDPHMDDSVASAEICCACENQDKYTPLLSKNGSEEYPFDEFSPKSLKKSLDRGGVKAKIQKFSQNVPNSPPRRSLDADEAGCTCVKCSAKSIYADLYPKPTQTE